MQNSKHRSRVTLFIAVLASFLIPGLGQVIGGRFYRGLWQTGLLLALFIITKVSGLFVYGMVGVVTFALLGILKFYSAYDAYRINNHINVTNLPWYNKWYYYLIVGISFFVLQYGVITSLGYRSFIIATDSSAPTLEKGELVIVKMNAPAEYKRNSFVIFSLPKTKDFTATNAIVVKRIVALEGETLAINNHTVYVNNKPLSEPYVLAGNNQNPKSKNIAPHLIPKGYVFVLGDNRDVSADSRYFGDVKIDDIKGKAIYILLSKNFRKLGQPL